MTPSPTDLYNLLSPTEVFFLCITLTTILILAFVLASQISIELRHERIEKKIDKIMKHLQLTILTKPIKRRFWRRSR